MRPSAVTASSRAAVAAMLTVAVATVVADLADGERAVQEGDYETGFRVFLTEAEAGDPRAQALVANMYRQGWGVPADPQAAFQWYRRAAQGGDLKAQYNLGVAYRDGMGTAADPEASTRWFETAARRGSLEAQINLALRYAKGRGVERNDVLAYAWMLKAAGRGDAVAIGKLRTLRKGLGPEQFEEARRIARSLP